MSTGDRTVRYGAARTGSATDCNFFARPTPAPARIRRAVTMCKRVASSARRPMPTMATPPRTASRRPSVRARRRNACRRAWPVWSARRATTSATAPQTTSAIRTESARALLPRVRATSTATTCRNGERPPHQWTCFSTQLAVTTATRARESCASIASARRWRLKRDKSAMTTMHGKRDFFVLCGCCCCCSFFGFVVANLRAAARWETSATAKASALARACRVQATARKWDTERPRFSRLARSDNGVCQCVNTADVLEPKCVCDVGFQGMACEDSATVCVKGDLYCPCDEIDECQGTWKCAQLEGEKVCLEQKETTTASHNKSAALWTTVVAALVAMNAA